MNVRSQDRDGITVVALDRPERRNALVPPLVGRLLEELQSASTRGRPIVLTATGPTFCPGADLKWMATFGDPSIAVAELVAIYHQTITSLLDMPVPVIAALNGAVAGGGLGLALAADYRVAAQRATFTAGYFRLGLTPDGGASALLPQLIGRARVLELLLTNRQLSAETAREWGLVNEVVADQDVVERAVALARSLEEVPGYALRETRSLLDTANLRNQLQLESVAIRTAARGAWFRNALQAFLAAHPD